MLTSRTTFPTPRLLMMGLTARYYRFQLIGIGIIPYASNVDLALTRSHHLSAKSMPYAELSSWIRSMLFCSHKGSVLWIECFMFGRSSLSIALGRYVRPMALALGAPMRSGVFALVTSLSGAILRRTPFPGRVGIFGTTTGPFY